MFKRTAVGIDLGTRTLRAVELQLGDKEVGVVGALKIDRAKLQKEVNPDAGPRGLARAIRAQLVRAGIGTKNVVLGIETRDSLLRYARVPPVPAWRLKLIMDYEVNEASEKLEEPLASDFRVLPLPRDAEEDQAILLTLAKEGPLAEVLDSFEAEGVTVAKAIPGSVGLYCACDTFLSKPDPDAEEDEVVIVADIGSHNTSVVILLNGRLLFARSLTFGGRQFTQALAQDLQVSKSEAEKIKIRQAGLNEGITGVLLDTVAPLRNCGGQLLGALQSSLRLAASQTGVDVPDLSKVIVLGGGAQVRGLPAFLGDGLQRPVESFRPQGLAFGEPPQDKTLRKSWELLRDRPETWGTVLGLAAAGLKHGTNQEGLESLNILPAKYVQRREFRDRTVFLYAAAAFLVVLLLSRLVLGFVRHRDAAEMLRTNQQVHNALVAKKSEHEQNMEEENAARGRLNRLLLEAEQSSFQAFVLDYLGKSLRPEVQIQQIEHGMSRDAPEHYVLQINGRVNNEKRRALSIIKELQSAFLSQDRVSSAEVFPSPEGAWYRFEMQLRPNTVRY